MRWWLPERGRADIIAELSADLHGQIEDRERELGRPLGESEIETVLKRCGQPYKVAARYLPQRVLIGPAIFPVYLRVLRLVLALTIVPPAIGWIVLAFLNPHARETPGWLTPLRIWATLWPALLMVFGVVTIVFAAIEYAQSRAVRDTDWSPRRLPPVRDAWRISRVWEAFGLAWQVVFLGWWLATPRGGWGVPGVGFGWPAGPMLHDLRDTFFVWVALLLLAGVSLSIANLARPYWTRMRRGARLVLFAGGTVLCFLFVGVHRGDFHAQVEVVRGLTAHPGGVRPEAVAAVITDICLYLSLLASGLGALASAVVETVRIARGNPQG